MFLSLLIGAERYTENVTVSSQSNLSRHPASFANFPGAASIPDGRSGRFLRKEALVNMSKMFLVVIGFHTKVVIHKVEEVKISWFKVRGIRWIARYVPSQLTV